MTPIFTSNHRLYSRADSVRDPAVWISLIFIGIILAWIIICLCFCPCFFRKHACQAEGWNACCSSMIRFCCACRPKPEDMARERDLWAEDRIREELRLRYRSRDAGMSYQAPTEGLERASRAVDDDVAQEEEQLPQYKPRTETSERERLNAEILERRRNEELAASDEREMPIDEQRRPYDQIMIAEPPPAYVEPRTKIL